MLSNTTCDPVVRSLSGSVCRYKRPVLPTAYAFESWGLLLLQTPSPAGAALQVYLQRVPDHMALTGGGGTAPTRAQDVPAALRAGMLRRGFRSPSFMSPQVLLAQQQHSARECFRGSLQLQVTPWSHIQSFQKPSFKELAFKDDAAAHGISPAWFCIPSPSELW